jgi:hypothetical protein
MLPRFDFKLRWGCGTKITFARLVRSALDADLIEVTASDKPRGSRQNRVEWDKNGTNGQ